MSERDDEPTLKQKAEHIKDEIAAARAKDPDARPSEAAMALEAMLASSRGRKQPG